MATFILNIPVPSAGDGVAVNVSVLVGEKTVTLSGTFEGQYVLLGSHDGIHFDPILSFKAGGIEGIQQTFSGALQWVRIRSQVTGAQGVTANISGLSLPGNNTFGIFPTLVPGDSGPQPSSDLGLVNYQGDVNFLAQGGVQGSVVVEGSLDDQDFNPIGSFSAEPASSSLLGAQSFEFSPLATGDRIRYVRLNVKGTILSPFTVTMGGSQTATGGGASEAIHAAYEVGSVPLDQTFSLEDAQGGKVIFDASDMVGFTDPEAVQVLVPGGEGAAFRSAGGMVLGPRSIEIGVSGYPANCNDGSLTDGSSIAIGLGAHTNGYDSFYGSDNIAMGWYAEATGTESIAIGPSEYAGNDIGSGYYSEEGCVALGAYGNAWGTGCIAIGFETTAGGQFTFPSSYNAALAIGYQAAGYADMTVAIGRRAIVWGNSSIAVGDGASISDLFDSDYSVAVGPSSTVIGMYSVALGLALVGDSTIGAADYSVSIGFSSYVYSDNAIAVGSDAVAAGPDSIAIGHESVAGVYAYGSQLAETGGIAIGSSGPEATGAWASGNFSIAIGSPALTWGQFNVALGYYAEAGDHLSGVFSNNNVAIGYEATVGYQGLSVSTTYDDNVVVGHGAGTYGVGTVVMGMSASVGQVAMSAIPLNDCIAMGANASVLTDYGIAIGSGSTVSSNGQGSIALGPGVYVDGNNSVGIGSDGTGMSADSSVAIGDDATVASSYSVAIGQGVTVGADYSVSIGSGANTGEAGNQGCVAIGLNASAGSPAEQDNWGIAIGAGSTIVGDSNIAIGLGATVTGTNTVVMGNGASTNGGDQNTCVGYNAQVQGTGSWNVCLGDVAQVQNDGLRNVVVGDGANVHGTSADGCVVVGTGSSADGDYHVAIGAGVQAVGTWTIAIGTNAVTSGVSAIAIGYGATAGANETVFDQYFGHVQTFRVVSNEPGVGPGTVLDLFQFAESNLTANNTTDMALLIQDHNGNIKLVPVYLSVPIGGVSTLLVANP